jgi:hypothetical protein
MHKESLQVLESARIAPPEARAIVRAIELEIAGLKGTLATKHDFEGLRNEISKLGVDLHAEINRAASQSTREMYFALLWLGTVTLALVCFLFVASRAIAIETVQAFH